MGQAIAHRTVLAIRHPATIVAVALAAAFGIAVLIHPAIWGSFTAMAGGDKDALRAMILSFGAFAPIASILLNIAQAVLAPIPGFVVPFVNGAVFGVWWGMLITWVGGIAAASTCFWIARTFGKGFAHKICSQFKIADEINAKLERHAFVALISARLIPGVPFDFLSYFVGLTRVKYTPFVVATAIGSAPHAYLYAVMGDKLHIPLWIGVLMTPALGLVFAAVKYVVGMVRRTRTPIDIPEIVVIPTPAVAGRPRALALAQWVGTIPTATCASSRAVPMPTWATSPTVSRARPVLRSAR
jgi:uncharacterized membrane protein YdjX (TVP38/TMEM64 family)